MQITIPDYYKDFSCIAGSCPDTCCAGWQIMIDKKSLKKYRSFQGPFRDQLRGGIHFRSGSFRQNNGRCAFLNDRDLCDIYSATGKQMLCDTCRTYPRHIEEFEGLREISLSLSCPEAARIILNQSSSVSWASIERKDRDDEFEDFDIFLFSILMDSRDYILNVLQNRSIPIAQRMQKILAYAYDLQLCIDRNQFFRVEEIRERHIRSRFGSKFHKKCRNHTPASVHLYDLIPDMWNTILPHMEVLNADWPGFVRTCMMNLYDLPDDECQKARKNFRRQYPSWETECEQLLVYWIFTYFCSAVYDGDAFTKVKMAVINTLLMMELATARFLIQKQHFSKEDQIGICYRYSRELEHSDENLNKLEELLAEKTVFSFGNLLKASGTQDI